MGADDIIDAPRRLVACGLVDPHSPAFIHVETQCKERLVLRPYTHLPALKLLVLPHLRQSEVGANPH